MQPKTNLAGAVLAAVVLGATALSVTPTAAAYTQTATTVLFLHGYADGGPHTANYNSWEIDNHFRSNGYSRVILLDYYGGACGRTDSARDQGNPSLSGSVHTHHHGGTHVNVAGCDSALTAVHDRNTDIRHLAYHVAWWIKTYANERIDVVAHSMGGLIIRYAMAAASTNPSTFPTLNIEDVVTLSTAHSGTYWACNLGYTQTQQMCPGSSFLSWLSTNAANPQGPNGTDWTVMGSDDDNWVNTDRAIAMSARHKVKYTDDYFECPLEHADYLYYEKGLRNDCNVDYWDEGSTWKVWNDAPGPVLWAHNAARMTSW